MSQREYVCADCKVNVFEFTYPDALDRTSPRCAGCEMIHEMKAKGQLSPKQELDLREIMDCMIPREDDDALRPTDASPG